MSEPPPETNGNGEGIPWPLRRIALMNDRHVMETELLRERVYAFIDGLNVEQLLTLRDILGFSPEAPMNNYIEGLVVQTLRLMHKVDPSTGLTEEEAVAQAQRSDR